MFKQLKWLGAASAMLAVAMGLTLTLQLVRAACGPANQSESCSALYGVNGNVSSVNVPASASAPTVPVVDSAQFLPTGALLYTDYVTLEAQARSLLDRSVKFRQDISPYRQTNNFNKLVRQFDVNAGYSAPYDDPSAAIMTMTLQQRIDLAVDELHQARNIYAVLAVYAPEPRMRTDSAFITTTVQGFAGPLCGAISKENPNPPDPQHTGEVLDSVVDWCDFPSRLRQAAREAAYLRMIFAQQFMVNGLGLNFGSNLLGGEEFVKKEVAKFDAAKFQFELAQRGLNEALGFRLGSGCYLADFYTQSEWSLLSRAAEGAMTAQHHIAIRQSYLDINTLSDVAKAQGTAQETYRSGAVEGYIKMIGLSGLAAVNPAGGVHCNAKGARPDSALSAEIARNIQDTAEKAREMRAGRNVFGVRCALHPSPHLQDRLWQQRQRSVGAGQRSGGFGAGHPSPSDNGRARVRSESARLAEGHSGDQPHWRQRHSDGSGLRPERLQHQCRPRCGVVRLHRRDDQEHVRVRPHAGWF